MVTKVEGRQTFKLDMEVGCVQSYSNESNRDFDQM